MLRYIIRRLLTMVLTMLVVSIVVFGIVEIAPGNVARNILGAYATPEQEKSMENQLGLDRPIILRYLSWLFGSDWQAATLVGRPLTEIVISQGTVERHHQWWEVAADGILIRWDVEDGHLYREYAAGRQRGADNRRHSVRIDGDRQSFWASTMPNGAQWVIGQGGTEYRLSIRLAPD